MKETCLWFLGDSTGDKKPWTISSLQSHRFRDVDMRTNDCLHNPTYKEAREINNLSSQSHIDLEYCSVPYHYHFSKPIRRDRYRTAKNNSKNCDNKFKHVARKILLDLSYLCRCFRGSESDGIRIDTNVASTMWTTSTSRPFEKSRRGNEEQSGES